MPPLLVALHSDDLGVIKQDSPVLPGMLHQRSTRQHGLDLRILREIGRPCQIMGEMGFQFAQFGTRQQVGGDACTP